MLSQVLLNLLLYILLFHLLFFSFLAMFQADEYNESLLTHIFMLHFYLYIMVTRREVKRFCYSHPS